MQAFFVGGGAAKLPRCNITVWPPGLDKSVLIRLSHPAHCR